MERFTGILGILAILAVAYLFSTSRKSIQPRVLAWGLTLQFGFAFLVLKTPVARAFQAISAGVNHLLEYAAEGSKFVFSDKLGAPSEMFGTIFAFQVLPIIIFIAALFGILYYLGVMQVLVRAMAVLMLLVDDSGIDPRKVSIAGYGQYRPVADNSTPEGRQLNRRVDLVVVGASMPPARVP